MSDSDNEYSQFDEQMSNDDDYELQFAENDFQFQNSPLRPLPFVFNDITDRVNNRSINNNSRGPTQNGHSSNLYPSQEKPRVLARIQSEELVRALNSISVSKDFIDEFDSKYGTLHPSFIFGSFSSALEKARSHQKLIIVYIHTEFTTEGLNILLEETVADYIDSNFMFWIGNYTNPSPQLDNLIMEMLPPILAVVGVDSNGNTNVIEFLHGINNIDILISRLMTVQDNFALSQQEANREKKMVNQILEKDRLLKLEQEQALLISQEADIRKQQEEEMIRRAIEEQEQQMKREREKREQDVQEKHRTLPPEPSDPKQSTDVIFRLADGSRLQRKFNRTDTVEALYTFVQIKCPELYIQGEGFQLVVSFPKKILTDQQQTLSAACLVPQAMIYVQL